MALVARNVLRHGRSAGFATSAGICTGILGLGDRGRPRRLDDPRHLGDRVHRARRLAGAAYLIYLGIPTLLARDMGRPGVNGGSALRLRHGRSLQGLLSALLNPKLGVFFLTCCRSSSRRAIRPSGGPFSAGCVFDLIGLSG